MSDRMYVAVCFVATVWFVLLLAALEGIRHEVARLRIALNEWADR